MLVRSGFRAAWRSASDCVQGRLYPRTVRREVARLQSSSSSSSSSSLQQQQQQLAYLPDRTQFATLRISLPSSLTNEDGNGEDDDAALRDAVRNVCSRFPGEYWRELDAHSKYPTEFVCAMQEAGFLAMLVPSEFGGTGLSVREAGVVLEEVHRAGCNGGAAHAQMYMMTSLVQFGTEHAKKTWLPRIASGETRFQAFGISESDSGTDTLSLKTHATKHKREETRTNGEHDGMSPYEWRINGHKIWTSRAAHSDLMFVLARTEAPHTREAGGLVSRSKQLSAFILDLNEARKEGTVTINPIDTMVNHSTTQVFFDGARVPDEFRLGNEGDGFKVALASMNAERCLIASECLGDARFFIDRAVAHANSRIVFGRPIAQNQGVQFPIAEAYIALEAATLATRAAMALCTANANSCAAECMMAKHLASEASWKAGEVCMQTLGGFAFAKEYDVERKWRETRLYRIAPISTNLIYSHIAHKTLGMPKSF